MSGRAIPTSPAPVIPGRGRPTGVWDTGLVDDEFLPAEPLCPTNRPQVIHRLCPTPSPPRSFASGRHVLCSGVCPDDDRDPVRRPTVLNLQPTSEGVLPGQLLERAIRAGYIDAGRFNIPDANVQPASLDLRLGERALRIRCSFLPGTDSVERKLKDYILDEIDLRGDGAMLEARCPYLIELKERLDLPAGLRGKANPKSSTGRIDVFTRVITDNSDRFDEVAPGYSRPAVPGGRPALLRRPGPGGPDAQPAPPVHRPPVAQRRRGPADAPARSRSSTSRACRCRSTTSSFRTASSSGSICGATSGDRSGTARGTARRCST